MDIALEHGAIHSNLYRIGRWTTPRTMIPINAILLDAGVERRTPIRRAAVHAWRRPKAAVFSALGLGLLTVVQSSAFAGPDPDAAAVRDEAIRMQAFIVSATRIAKNPWKYSSHSGIEVLSRASDDVTHWQRNALMRGLLFENDVLPKDWLPPSAVPYTVIIDDVDLRKIAAGQLHSLPMKLGSPLDPGLWGELSESLKILRGAVRAYDADTFAANYNLYGLSGFTPEFGLGPPAAVYSSISWERLVRCTPPLPQWLLAGLLGTNSGIFREGFVFVADPSPVVPGSYLTLNASTLHPPIRRAKGPGTLWGSLGETQQLLAQLNAQKLPEQLKAAEVLSRPTAQLSERLKAAEVLRLAEDGPPAIPFLPLSTLFAETPSTDEARELWESEAALFVRWGLLGPGHDDPILSRAFLELVRRSRSEPVTERMFTDCFGFDYGAMETKLAAYLRVVLAMPISVGIDMPLDIPGPDMREATADEIGRILGDWLRMKGASFRKTDPELSNQFLDSAGRILKRAYRDDNGLPPDVEPPFGGEHSAKSAGNAAFGSAVAMKPFAVTASRIHDPRLLAVYGLYEHDIGDDQKARELLEAAVKANVERPQADVVLAELRYAEAIARPLGSKGALSAQQVASILVPLRTALRHAPTVGACSLTVETWARSELKPTDQEVEDMANNAALFPRDTDLAFNSAVLCARDGYPAQAAKLIDQGLLFTPPGRDRDYFERLRLGLAAHAASGAK